MKRLALLGALLAAAMSYAGAAESGADGLLPMRGGEESLSLRKNDFQAVRPVSGAGIAADFRPADPPARSLFPVYLKWKNVCRARRPDGFGEPDSADDFSRVAPYFGPAALPAVKADWLEAPPVREGEI